MLGKKELIPREKVNFFSGTDQRIFSLSLNNSNLWKYTARMSDHKSGTPWPICLKVWLGNFHFILKSHWTSWMSQKVLISSIDVQEENNFVFWQNIMLLYNVQYFIIWMNKSCCIMVYSKFICRTGKKFTT